MFRKRRPSIEKGQEAGASSTASPGTFLDVCCECLKGARGLLPLCSELMASFHPSCPYFRTYSPWNPLRLSQADEEEVAAAMQQHDEESEDDDNDDDDNASVKSAEPEAFTIVANLVPDSGDHKEAYEGVKLFFTNRFEQVLLSSYLHVYLRSGVDEWRLAVEC